MLQFLQPIWLWASAAIAIPVAIHLWNVKEGKTLKVGSLLLFRESAKAAAKSFRLSQLLLLLLRCLLLLTLAMLIAKPVWEKSNLTNEKGWILIEKDQLQEAYKAYQPLIDSLVKSGYAFHYFDESFEEKNMSEALQIKNDRKQASQFSYWALLKESDNKIPFHLPVYLFTDNTLKRFTGERPALSLHLKWYTFLNKDSTASWLAKAYKMPGDSVRLVTGNSSYSGTHYSYQNLSYNNNKSEYKITGSDGKPAIQKNDSLHQRIEIDTSAITIIIYANKYSKDADYVKAAVEAIKEITQFNIKVAIINDVKNIPDQYNWLFWLSDENMPANRIKGNVFKYENGMIINKKTSLYTNDAVPLSISENIALYQYIVADSASSLSNQIIWKNGFDDPVLSLEKNHASVYHFYTHFNPQWNDWVWSNAFPQEMYDLLFHHEQNDDSDLAYDKRIIDTSQIQPVRMIEKNMVTKKNSMIEQDLSPWFWSVAFFIFIAERLLSFRLKKETT